MLHRNTNLPDDPAFGRDDNVANLSGLGSFIADGVKFAGGRITPGMGSERAL